MNKFNMGGRGRHESEFGGRPKADANYGPKKRFSNDARRDGGNRYNDRGPKEVQLFKATCTTCGKPCEVPFRPDGQKPVLCRDCFASKNSAPSNSGNFERRDRSDERKPERNYEAPRVPAATGVSKAELVQLTSQIMALETKVSELLAIVKSNYTKPELVKIAEASEIPEPKVKVLKIKKDVVKKVAKKPAKKVAKK